MTSQFKRPTAMLLCLFVSMTTIVLVFGEDYKCPEEWTLYEEGQTCLRIQSDYKSWEDAREVCKETNGGDLAKISDQEMNSFVQGKAAKNKRYWIGLNDLDKDGKFQWLDEQEQPSFFDWQKGKPNNVKKHHCVEIVGAKGGSWNNRKCSQRRPFICQTDAEKVVPLPESLNYRCVFEKDQEEDICGYQVVDSTDLDWELEPGLIGNRQGYILSVENTMSTPGELKLHSIFPTGDYKCLEIGFNQCTHGMTFGVSGQGFDNSEDCVPEDNLDYVLVDLQPSDTFTVKMTLPETSSIDVNLLNLIVGTCEEVRRQYETFPIFGI